MSRGFTLIEIMVVMAIIAVLAGIMVPFAYRVWESSEIEITKERMRDLKKAMVGDPKLIQNGVRIHYGYVGDNGQLPAALSDLVPAYMPAGYDPGKYNRDAWGGDLIYAPGQDASGRYSYASLTSRGPDGIINTTDDIDNDPSHTYAPELQIDSREVLPTGTIRGNVTVILFNPKPGPVTADYSVRVFASYAGAGSSNSGCLPLGSSAVGPGETLPVSKYFSENLGEDLPIGIVRMQGRLYDNNSCTGAAVAVTNYMAAFVNDNLNALAVNLPAISYTIP